jgi:hypothetical protein
MVADIPEIKVAQYLFNDVKFFNERDNFHGTLAFWTHKPLQGNHPA